MIGFLLLQVNSEPCSEKSGGGFSDTLFDGDHVTVQWQALQPKKEGAAIGLLLIVAFALLFSFLGSRGLWAAEGRWAQVVREMFQMQDFFHPTIGGEPYFDKPLLTYWLIALISVVTGTLNELTIRLPSAVSGFVAIWAIMRLGTLLWSARVGRIAGWILLTTYSFLFWSRTGTADAENLAVVILAVYWYAVRRDRINFWTFLVFYLITFVGAHTKGLTAVAVPVLFIFPDVLKEKRWQTLFKPAHFMALALGLAVYMAPFVIASMTRLDYESSGLALVFQENIQRFFQPIDHKGPFYLYVYALPQLLLPWTPVWGVAVFALLKRWRDLDGHTQWLIQAVGAVFLLFTLSGSRRSYYILPLLPFCALQMAVFLADDLRVHTERLRQWAIGIQAKVFVGLIVFELFLSILWVILKRSIAFEVPLLFYIVTLAGALAAAAIGFMLYRKTQPEYRVVFASIGMAVVLLGVYFGPQQRILEANRTERPFAKRVGAYVSGLSLDQVAIFPKVNANVLFYLGTEKPIRIIKNPLALKGFLDETSHAVLITQHRYRDRIPEDVSIVLEGYHCLDEALQTREDKPSKQEEKWVVWLKEMSGDAAVVMPIQEYDNHAK